MVSITRWKVEDDELSLRPLSRRAGWRPSSIYSWFINVLYLLHINWRIWMVGYSKFLSKFWRKKKICKATLLSRYEKLKNKHPPKTKKNSNVFFPYCPELPKWPKQKNSCSKMWLIDQLYIKLGYPATGADRGITQYAMGWNNICIKFNTFL